MSKVITVTLNPSLDETLLTRHLRLGYYNHVVGSKHIDASGRGVNVSRALSLLGISTHGVVVLGSDEIARAYEGLLDEDDFDTSIIRYDGPTRSDTIIVDTGTNHETHIVDEDSVGPRNDVRVLMEQITDILEPDDIVVCAGHLPRDTPHDVYAKLVKAVHDKNGRVVVVANGEPLKQASRAAPDLVLLTQLEAEALFNYPVRTLADMHSVAKRFMNDGCKQVLIIMTDFKGVLLATQEGVYVATASEIDKEGTDSGVADALLAAYLSGMMHGNDSMITLKRAVAAMLFAAKQIGNAFGASAQIAVYQSQVAVQSLAAKQ